MPQQKLSNEEQILSLDQVKQFIFEHGDNDRYNGKCTVYVNQYGVEEVYQIEVSISFDGSPILSKTSLLLIGGITKIILSYISLLFVPHQFGLCSNISFSSK